MVKIVIEADYEKQDDIPQELKNIISNATKLVEKSMKKEIKGIYIEFIDEKKMEERRRKIDSLLFLVSTTGLMLIILYLIISSLSG